jgi:uncharacterized DUF497 family protein
MSKKDSILLLLLALTAAAAFFYTTITISQDKIHESEKAVERYESALQKVKAETERNGGHSAHSLKTVKVISITDAADLILSQLKKEGIIPDRYQITGTDSRGQKVEFVFTCGPEKFIRFISSAEGDESSSYTITDASVKQKKSGGISVVMHASASPCRFVPWPDTGTDKLYRLPRLFTGRIVTPSRDDTPAAAPAAPEQGTAKFRIIGTVRGADGIQYLYVKNTGNDKLYKLAPDKIRESTASRYILVIDGTEYEILKNR